jgi:lysophospholipid acyltransferase (LPLAT)-like uncharacterized protein
MPIRAAGDDSAPGARRGGTILERLALQAGSWIARALIVCLRHVMTWASEGEEVVTSLHDGRRPYIHAFYHDQLLMMTYSYLGRSRGRQLVVLSSRHRDGEYVSRTLERFGHRMVRGSTGRGGAAGLRELIRSLRGGQDVAVAVDGPRGPRHHVQTGVIEAARLGAAPIVPVAFAASRARTLRSWDAFLVPVPLARGAFVYGEPIAVPADADRAAMEMARRVLQDRLDRLTIRAQTLARGAAASGSVQPNADPGEASTVSSRDGTP